MNSQVVFTTSFKKKYHLFGRYIILLMKEIEVNKNTPVIDQRETKWNPTKENGPKQDIVISGCGLRSNEIFYWEAMKFSTSTSF